MNEFAQLTNEEASTPHELDFLLRSLNTSTPTLIQDDPPNNFQNIVNFSFSDYSPIPVQFIDQTPSPYSTFSPIISSNEMSDYISCSSDTLHRRRKRNGERPIDLDRSRIAQRRKRDESGKFLRKEVAMKIEELESKVKEKEEECINLRQTLSAKEQEISQLRNQLQNQSIMNNSYLAPVPMINLPSRNYVLIPNPNPQQIPTEKREAFKEKIDYSKIQLRKTDSLLDDEKREVLLSQEQWEEQRRLHEFLRKLEEQQRWYNAFVPEQYNEGPSPQSLTPLYGGPPSNIYSPPTKIGNLQVPAFTTKVDFSSKREELGKKESRNKQYVLVEQSPQPMMAKSQPTPIPNTHSRQRSVGKFPIPNLHTQTQLQNQIQLQNLQMQNQLQTQMQTQMQNQFQNQMQNQMQTQFQSQMKNIQPYPLIDAWDDQVMELDSSNTFNNTPRRQYSLGGPPSNIYTPPTKIGNLAVPAFTHKIDFSEIELRKTEGPYSSSPPL